MTADEARKKTEIALNSRSALITPYLQAVYARIDKMIAERGEYEIMNPFNFTHEEALDFNIKPWPSVQIREALQKHLTKEGYVIKEHPNPDSGDPRSSSYTTLSWK